MNELILHHYANSPFSEKVRLILGAKRMAWRSVHVPSVMPKPDVVALCEQVASSAGGFLGIVGKVSDEERKLIDEIAGHLGGGAQKLRQSLG